MAELQALTDTQLAVFTFCREWVDEKQSFPAMRVIASAFKFKSQNSAIQHIESLIKKGYLTRWEYKYRDTTRKKQAISVGYQITDAAKLVSFKTLFEK